MIIPHNIPEVMVCKESISTREIYSSEFLHQVNKVNSNKQPSVEPQASRKRRTSPNLIRQRKL